ncbi:MAG: relaxase domain-containing protein [Acidimicrobiales bacterium]
MLRIFSRRSSDVSYFTDDHALELEGMLDGPGWWLRGEGDTRVERDVAQVLVSTRRASVLGYDLIFAAPRAVSILVALDPANAGPLLDAHRSSVASSMSYLEQRALVVRDRRAGEDRDEPGRWESMVGFTHGVNRHGEPHVHDHVLVGARLEHATSVLDARSLYVHARTADELYRSSLRHLLAQRTPWVAWRSFRGVEHVIGVDEGYRALWGGHFDDRGEKHHWRREEIVSRWREDAVRFEAAGEVPAPARDREGVDEHVFGAALEGSREITRRQLVGAWAKAATYGQGSEEIERSIDLLYPSLRTSRGVREMSIGIAEARMIALVRERGPRPLASVELERWTQRSRERSLGLERSR